MGICLNHIIPRIMFLPRRNTQCTEPDKNEPFSVSQNPQAVWGHYGQQEGGTIDGNWSAGVQEPARHRSGPHVPSTQL